MFPRHDHLRPPLEPDDRFLGGVSPLPAPRKPERPASRLTAGPTLLLAEPVYRDILDSLTWPPETFGLLLGPKRQDHVVTHFVFDAHAQATPGSITIDHAGLSAALKRFTTAGLDCKGFAHAHPPGCESLSYGDFTALRALFAREKNRGLTQFFMPLSCGGRLVPYVVFREDLDSGLDSARLAQLLLF